MDFANQAASSSEYLLLFRGTAWDHALSPAELQQALATFRAWFDRLSQEAVLKAGQPLMNEGRIVSGKTGRAAADGPFTETKEAIGGYFLIAAPGLDAAVAIAKECPLLKYGGSVEVRPIAAVCPTMQRAQSVIAASLAQAHI